MKTTHKDVFQKYIEMKQSQETQKRVAEEIPLKKTPKKPKPNFPEEEAEAKGNLRIKEEESEWDAGSSRSERQTLSPVPKPDIEDLLRTIRENEAKLKARNEELAVITKKHKLLINSFMNLRDSGKFTDKFLFHGKKYTIHKCLIAAQSSKLAEMLTEGATTVKKEDGDFSGDVYESFFSFFYTQEIQNEDHAMNLLQLAVQYDVPGLKAASEKLVIKSLNETNALETYNFAHLNAAKKLKRAAFETIRCFHKDIGEYLYNQPDLLNQLMTAKLNYELEESDETDDQMFDEN